jgi:aminoglycoside 3-N-acetyltransferase
MGRSLTDDLASLGVREGGVLLVHSSYKSLGPLGGGPAEVIRGLQEALGTHGTLLMPALSYAAVTPEQPVFDVRATPSCVGIIPETFRRTPGVLRSMHPTHSVCASGPRARELLARHGSDTTPCGPGSPFRAVPSAGGQILMLGCGLRPNTSMHAVEELVVPPYLFGEQLTYTLVGEDGRQARKAYKTHGFVGWEQRYDRIQRLLGAPDLRAGMVLDAECYLLEAARLLASALEALRRDPLFFVDPLS